MRHHLGTVEIVFGRSACSMWGVTSAQYGQPNSGLIFIVWGVFFCPLRRKLLHFTTDLSETFRISLFQRTPQANKQYPSCTDFSSHNNSQQHSLTLWEFQSATKDSFKAPHNKEVAAHQQSQESEVPKPKQYICKGRLVAKFSQPTAITNGCQEWRLKRVETKDRRMQEQPIQDKTR